MNDHARGLAITSTGGLLLTFDIPLIRLGGGDIWSAQLVRCGACLAAGLVLWGVVRLFTGRQTSLLPGAHGVLVTSVYGLAGVFFIAAVFLTDAANLVVILATNSMFAAVFGRFINGERIAWQTMVTIAVTFIAVLFIVSDGVHSGNFIGDVCAAAASVLLALAITLIRRDKRDFGFAPIVGCAIPVLVSIAMLGATPTTFSLDAPGWALLNGAIVWPAALWCLATGPRYLPGPEVALFYLLETVMTPVWIWMIFSEVPSTAVLIGGTMIVVALAIHSVWRLKSGRDARLRYARIDD